MRRITERPPAATQKITPQQLSGGLQTESASRRPFQATTGDSKVNGVDETSHDPENTTTGAPPLGATGRTVSSTHDTVRTETPGGPGEPSHDEHSSCDGHRAFSSTTDRGAPALPDETEVAQEMQASLESRLIANLKNMATRQDRREREAAHSGHLKPLQISRKAEETARSCGVKAEEKARVAQLLSRPWRQPSHSRVDRGLAAGLDGSVLGVRLLKARENDLAEWVAEERAQRERETEGMERADEDSSVLSRRPLGPGKAAPSDTQRVDVIYVATPR
ncbi:hypothetical protein FOZ63_021684 [Perkinsus olseni]|uniref:Uncharacterized protein n=1 Tax=Perkinsus olseni TaxID=32597 RepID=A0A7J6UP67_PEROL|nr:hypothetical protein FOZ63_021684 [Perkinsus olseni]